MAIIIAAENENRTISVHAVKAVPNSGAGYLGIAIKQRSSALYNHFVPGCNGTSFLSVIAIDNNTCVAVDKYSYDYTAKTQQRTRLAYSTLHVRYLTYTCNKKSHALAFGS